MGTTFRRIAIQASFSLASMAGATAGLFALGSSPARAFGPSDINPAYTRALDTVVGARYPAGSPDASVGFFFDIASDNYYANALGISAQSNVPWTKPYTVALWSYDDSGPITAYTKLEEKVFDPSDPNLVSYDAQPDGFIDGYWLPLDSLRKLDNTSAAVDPDGFYGYAIAAYGSFNEPDGNFIESDGVITFKTDVVYDGNGYNIDGSPRYPIPVFIGENPPGTDAFGYWNPNLSQVPGPLPALGALGAFGWARQLRRRIKRSGCES